MTTFIAMCLFALVTSISPGPVNLIATSTGANYGFQRTIPHILGATIGFTSILLLIGIGVVEIIKLNPQVIEYIRYLGSSFLLYMSYKIAFTSSNSDSSKPQLEPPMLLEGLLCQWLNPKAWIVAVSGITVFSQDIETERFQIVLFSTLFFIVCFISISVWAILGVSLQKFLKSPTHFRYFNYVMGGFLSITVIYLLF